MSMPASPRIGAINFVFLLFLFWFASNLPIVFFRLGGPPPVLSYLVFLVFGATVLLVKALQRKPVLKSDDWQRLRTPLIWVYVWLFLAFVGFLGSSQSGVAEQVLIVRLEMALILAFLLLLTVDFQRPEAIGLSMAAVAVFGAAVNIYDFFQPTFSTVPGRAAGLYLNPNISAFILCQCLIFGAPFLPKPLRWPFVAFLTIGVFLTFARSGWIALFVSLSVLFWIGALGFERIRAFVGISVIAAAGFFGYSILSGLLVDVILDTALVDYLDSNTLARLGLVEFASDYSANERTDAVAKALETYVNSGRPLLGVGLGYTFEWDFPVSTHNMYALYLTEGGMVGIALYVALIAIMLIKSRGLGRLVAFNIAIYSFFSHNILDSPGRLVLITLVLIGFMKNSERAQPATQDRSRDD